MFCPKCGKELQEGSLFCGGCGNKLNFSPKNEADEQAGPVALNADGTVKSDNKVSVKNVMIICGTVILAVAVIVAACILIFSSDDKDALFKNNMLMVSGFDDSSYIINKNGDVVADGAEYLLSEKSDLIMYTNDKDKFGYIDKNGQTVINPQFDLATLFDESGLAVVRLGEKMGYINKTGKYVINPQFDCAYPFGDNKYAVVRSGGKYGYIDKKGKYIINPQFDSANEFADNNTALVSSGGKYGYIDLKGKYLINPQFDMAYDFMDNGLARVYINGQYGYIDKTGKYVINPQFDYASDFDCKGLAVVEVDGSFGYIDKNGNYIINPQFDAASGFTENGLAVVSMNGVYGYINKKGEFEINPQFETAYDFSKCGIARVVSDGEYSYIDEKGNFIISPKYGYALDFYSDGYGVAFDNSAHIIDKKGNELAVGTIRSCFSFDSEFINKLVYLIDSDTYDMDFSSDYEAMAYLSEILGDDLFEKTMWIAELGYYYDSLYSKANSKAKEVYQSAANILTKCYVNDVEVADGMYCGSLSYSGEKPETDFSKGDAKGFVNNMVSYMGSNGSDAGYFAVYVKEGSPVRSFWSEDPQLDDKAKKKILTDNEEFSYIVGGYPTEIH